MEDLREINERLARLERIAEGKPKVLTVQEAAAMLHLSVSRVYHLARLRRLPFYRSQGRRIWFAVEELEAWQKAKRIPTDEDVMREAAQYRPQRTGRAKRP